MNVVYGNIFNDVSVEMLAEQTNRSLTSFKKEFKRLFNAPPHRWIIEQRLDRAKIMLSSTSRTVSEIGAECAFANISHFIKLFKQRYHETPASFRRRNTVQLSQEEQCNVAG
jgi:AraC-like DNA-binding protein